MARASLYETQHQPALSRSGFYRRVGLHLAAAAGLLGASLVIGILGYVLTEHLSPIDAFVNAAMLLGGMGPIDRPMTFAGKLFAGIFALYAGLLFIVCAALVLTPVLHRVLHRFHVEERS
jgi:hypothetical protein